MINYLHRNFSVFGDDKLPARRAVERRHTAPVQHVGVNYRRLQHDIISILQMNIFSLLEAIKFFNYSCQIITTTTDITDTTDSMIPIMLLFTSFITKYLFSI